MTSHRTLFALVLGCLLVATIGVAATQDTPAASKTVSAALGKLPLYFVENRGVYPEAARYYIQGADKTLFFTDAGVTFSLKGKDKGWTVKLDFVGANQDARPEGLDKQEAVFSYFKGPEKDWKAGLPTFSKIVYRDLWPGIDLVYNGTVNQLKYEFRVAPGADPSLIRLQYRGAASVTATDAGALRVATPGGSFEDAPPMAWQEINGRRVPVEMAYALGEEGRFGFTVGDYDCTKSLILDPAVIVYCGYIGGTEGGEIAFGVAVDTTGHTYVTGTTGSSASFPVRLGPSRTYSGARDAFVAKVNASGSGLLYCGYIGGDQEDRGNAIAVDAKGNAYVTGYTRSTQKTFPLSSTWPYKTHGGVIDAFVAKVNASGTGLVYCGYIGGKLGDNAFSIAVDGAGSAYVAGLTSSDHLSFPVKLGPKLQHSGGSVTGEGFVAKVNAAGNSLVYCGYVGGTGHDRCHGVAVDRSGNAYVAGFTSSTESSFFTKLGPALKHSGGGNDAFVARVNATTAKLDFCGYIGGAGSERAYAIALDKAGNAYVTGATSSDEKSFPVGGALDLTFNGAWDAFVAKVDAKSAQLVYCGYIGGAQVDEAYGIAVDGAGSVHLTGKTFSDQNTMPVKHGPDLTWNGGHGDAFVAKTNASGIKLVYCGYAGGSGEDEGRGIAVDAAGNAYVAGYTESTQSTFPVRLGPDLTYNQLGDAFVAKFAHTLLQASGAPRPGGTVGLTLTSTDDPGLPYQLGSSFGTGPIKIGSRTIGLSVDKLLEVSVGGVLPPVFVGYQGVIGTNGQASAKINIPNIPALVDQRIHTAFVTVDPKAPQGIKSISNTYSFRITK